MKGLTLQTKEHHGYRFDGFFLDSRNRTLFRDGQQLALNAKYLDVLLFLIEARDNVVSKQDLFDRIWKDVYVTDSALTQCIKDIRKVLGDSASNPKYIKTWPKRGYQFVAAARQMEPGQAREVPGRPYRFLESFTEEDAGEFYGRDEEIEEVCSRLLSHRTFLIYGRSGVGKSSFLAAGLIPSLRASNHFVCRIEGRRDPLKTFHENLCAYLKANSTADWPELARLFSASFPHKKLFLCCDQFEEWFIQDGGRFPSLEQHLLAPFGCLLHFCFVLREDFLAEMSGLKDAFPEIFHHEYRLDLLDRARAEFAIRKPAEKANCFFEEGLLDRVLDDLTGPEGVDLPALQIVCDHLYDRRDLNGAFTFAAHGELGHSGGILQSYLDRVLRRFAAQDLKLTRLALSLLISLSGERLYLPVADISEQVQAETGAERLAVILEELASARIIHFSNEGGVRQICLVHAYLVPAVTRWVTDEVKQRQRIREVFRRSLETYREQGFSMSEEGLQLVLAHPIQVGGKGAELLAKSCFHHSVPVPAAIAAACSDYLLLWREAVADPNPELRRGAILSVHHLDADVVLADLTRLALQDEELAVRREASLLLAEQHGAETPFLLNRRQEDQGFWRHTWSYLVCLAMIRDHDRQALGLWRNSALAGAFIVVCLAWVRLRRHWPAATRQVVGGTMGTSLAGLLIGLILGLVVVAFRPDISLNPGALILTFSSSGLVVGFLAGAAISATMAGVTTIAYRHSRFWQVAAAAAGGLSIGALFTQVANATSQTMLGMSSLSMTGNLEAALMAAATCLGATLALDTEKQVLTPRAVAAAAFAGGAMALVLVLLDRRLLAGSLAGMINRFQVIPEFDSFLPNMVFPLWRNGLKLIEAFAEGAFFGVGLFGGMLLFQAPSFKAQSKSSDGTDQANRKG